MIDSPYLQNYLSKGDGLYCLIMTDKVVNREFADSCFRSFDNSANKSARMIWVGYERCGENNPYQIRSNGISYYYDSAPANRIRDYFDYVMRPKKGQIQVISLKVTGGDISHEDTLYAEIGRTKPSVMSDIEKLNAVVDKGITDIYKGMKSKTATSSMVLLILSLFVIIGSALWVIAISESGMGIMILARAMPLFFLIVAGIYYCSQSKKWHSKMDTDNKPDGIKLALLSLLPGLGLLYLKRFKHMLIIALAFTAGIVMIGYGMENPKTDIGTVFLFEGIVYIISSIFVSYIETFYAAFTMGLSEPSLDTSSYDVLYSWAFFDLFLILFTAVIFFNNDPIAALIFPLLYCPFVIYGHIRSKDFKSAL